MKFPTRLILFAALLAPVVAAQFMTRTASAVTAELANKCRDMSHKAFPPQRVGTKGGNAGDARKYYNACIANGGSPPNDNMKKPAAAPAR